MQLTVRLMPGRTHKEASWVYHQQKWANEVLSRQLTYRDVPLLVFAVQSPITGGMPQLGGLA
jgi:hypothetical protein